MVKNEDPMRQYQCQECEEEFVLRDSQVEPVFDEPKERPVESGDLFHYQHRQCPGMLMYLIGFGESVPWRGGEEEDDEENEG